MKLHLYSILFAAAVYLSNAKVMDHDELCNGIKNGTITKESYEASGYDPIDNPHCASNESPIDSGRSLRETRALSTYYETNGEGGSCSTSYQDCGWWSCDTIYTSCTSNLRCLNHRCHFKPQDVDAVGHSNLMKLSEWIYTEEGGSRTGGVPSGFTRMYGKERYAIFKRSADASKCILVHRATFDSDEVYADVTSQFASSYNSHGMCVNRVFYMEYLNDIQEQQTIDINKALQDGCQSFDLVGHSLGGATIMMALTDLGSDTLQGKINDVVTLGLPRSLYTTGYSYTIFKDCKPTCSKMKNLINGKIYKYVRRKASNMDDGDPVPAIPLDWDHCAEFNIYAVSDDIDAANPILKDSFYNDTPNDSIYALDDLISWLSTFVQPGEQFSWHSVSRYITVAGSNNFE